MPRDVFGVKNCRVGYFMLTIFLAACGSGGGGGDNTPPPPPPPPAFESIAGRWLVAETSVAANNTLCQPPAAPLQSYSLWFTQSGSALTVVDESGDSFVGGTVSGTTVSYSGSYPDGAGTTTLNSVSVSVASSCNTATGSSSWSYAEPGFSCTGTTQFTATRAVGSGCSAAAGATTNSALNEAEPNDAPGAAQPVVRPVAISGSITSSTDLDFYAFSLAASSPVTLMLIGPSNQDVDLLLLDSAGTTVLDWSANFTSSEAIAQTLSAGSYKVLVIPYSVSASVSYTLIIQ